MLIWYLFSYCWFVSRELAGLLLSHVCSASCGEETATISKMAPTKESGPHMVVPNRMGLVYSRGKNDPLKDDICKNCQKERLSSVAVAFLLCHFAYIWNPWIFSTDLAIPEYLAQIWQFLHLLHIFGNPCIFCKDIAIPVSFAQNRESCIFCIDLAIPASFWKLK